MDLLRQILANEVFPAIGCTEPISCAYAAAAAAEQLPGPLERLELAVDPGTFKNGASVCVPNSGGRKGNVIAAAIGAMIARPELRLEILGDVPPAVLEKACRFVENKALVYRCREDRKDLYVEATAESGSSRVRCVVSEGHTNITCLEKDGKSILAPHSNARGKASGYREELRNRKLADVLAEVIVLDDGLRSAIQRGIDMNLSISGKGVALNRTAHQLVEMMRAGLMSDDLFFRVKLAVASAVDARMGGLPEPVMTSGGSGNQGVLTILVPYLVGVERGIGLERIQESVAISHAVNSYVKCFVGELSVVCGCAIATSIAASVALVYQEAGIDMRKITLAVGNVIGDLCGIICDGAKPGCSMKIMSGAETAMRSAFMALGGYGLSAEDGVLGRSAEESIRNLSRISLEGMGLVDPTVVHILQGKSDRHGPS
ncbi:MAG: L-serine ammonia-lyase, iron-sulfur-dependent, subunit alpha [Syntrophobacteraceae bacterium]|nr:L-serine ammonia-lyase, iron-sulfur-dependent, subunit alpha [Desulfobacteraceae bacterium]